MSFDCSCQLQSKGDLKKEKIDADIESGRDEWLKSYFVHVY